MHATPADVVAAKTPLFDRLRLVVEEEDEDLEETPLQPLDIIVELPPPPHRASIKELAPYMFLNSYLFFVCDHFFDAEVKIRRQSCRIF